MQIVLALLSHKVRPAEPNIRDGCGNPALKYAFLALPSDAQATARALEASITYGAAMSPRHIAYREHAGLHMRTASTSASTGSVGGGLLPLNALSQGSDMLLIASNSERVATNVLAMLRFGAFNPIVCMRVRVHACAHPRRRRNASRCDPLSPHCAGASPSIEDADGNGAPHWAAAGTGLTTEFTQVLSVRVAQVRYDLGTRARARAHAHLLHSAPCILNVPFFFVNAASSHCPLFVCCLCAVLVRRRT
ncbi:hypothetical protein EON66_01600 [archaeon]|nr:MAG: hypothetical protein EON66_01600 [archaeon]